MPLPFAFNLVPLSRPNPPLSLQLKIDRAESKRVRTNRADILRRALESYTRCLFYGDKENLRVFRLCSLWFSNAAAPAVNAAMTEVTLVVMATHLAVCGCSVACLRGG